MNSELSDLIHRVDLDGLVRYVDATCSNRDWEHLIDIRDDARSAVNTGRQLWPIATLANYRLALHAPAHLAVHALDDTARTFMPGPLSEIISIHHTWDELEPHVDAGPDRSLIAYERALRGDDIHSDETEALDIPLTLQPWEPRYVLATYDDDGPHCDPPLLPSHLANVQSDHHLDSTDHALSDEKRIDDDETENAVRELFSAWTTESNGSVRVTVVDGSATDALSAHGIRDVRIEPLQSQHALSLLAWAGASGGAHGSRRGGATGRFGIWWLCAAITDTIDDWPLTEIESHEAFASLQWHHFASANVSRHGWNVQLVVHDPENDISVCIDAHDYV